MGRGVAGGDLPAQTDPQKRRVLSVAHSGALECGCAAVRPTHSSLCPALIHLPTRYYRDTAEKNAESGLVDRNARRPGLNLNKTATSLGTTLGACYITLLQDSATSSQPVRT